MNDRNDERERAVFSASEVLRTLGESLSAIKLRDKLTFVDLGESLGVSDDQAAKYCEGTATMNIVTFARGKREWNGRFTGALDRLCVESRPVSTSDRAHGSSVLKAALALSVALEGDGKIDESDVRAHRGELENARDAIEAVLGKLKPRNVA